MAPIAESYSRSIGTKDQEDQLDSNDMLRQDAGKGLENIKFEDWNDPKSSKTVSVWKKLTKCAPRISQV